jgi:predicted TIM-barrel fold metal-dependent hydrolase
VLIDHPLVSADDHMDLNVLPPDLFSSGVPAEVRDRVPRVVEADDGPVWYLQDRMLAPSGRRAKGYRVTDERGYRPGVAMQRLEDMDRDRVFTHVMYGPLGGLPAADDEARLACIRTYNEWAASFNATDPNRLVVLAHLPSHTPEGATEELVRAASMGHRGAILEPFDAVTPPFESAWDGFWDAVADTGLPISFHIGGGMHSLYFVPGVWRAPATASVIAMQLDEVLVGLTFSGTLDKRPSVKVVMAEGGLGWVPYLLERMEQQHHRFKGVIGAEAIARTPHEIFREQVFLTYEEDEVGLAMIDRIGAGNVMWASDYPHGDSTWPRSHEAIAESPLAALDAPTRRAITCDNAARLYGIALPA